MDAAPSGSIILILLLVIINAFFASAEMAIVSLNKTKISLLAEEGNKKAILLHSLINEPSKFLATIQVGITLAGFFASASAATSLSAGLASTFTSFNIPYSHEIALVCVTVILSYITLVLGELLPKRIALQNSEKIAMFSIKPILFISKLTTPFVWLLSMSTTLLMKALGVKVNGLEEKISREEIQSLLEIGEEHGAINEKERDMIDNIIQFDDTLAKEIMTPRTEVFCLEVNDSIKENINLILDENFSRIPIYEENIDNIVGVLYMKDLFANVIKCSIENVRIRDIMRKPFFAPETNNIDDLFLSLQKNHNYIAILIDEYGGFSGIVTMEDLTEKVMGSISDEYDVDEPEVKSIDDKNYIVSGLLTIDEVNAALDLDLKSEFADTVAGLFLENFGRLPLPGETPEVLLTSIKLKLLSLDDKRIDRIQITLLT